MWPCQARIKAREAQQEPEPLGQLAEIQQRRSKALARAAVRGAAAPIIMIELPLEGRLDYRVYAGSEADVQRVLDYAANGPYSEVTQEVARAMRRDLNKPR